MRFSENSSPGTNPMPPEKLRCVWMTAGVLSYQLCDRQFDCEACPLDRAMRMHFTKGPEVAERPHDDPAGSPALLSRNHFWMTQTGAATWRAGIEPRLAGLLPPVKSVVLPAAGDLLDEHSPAAWIVFDDGTLPLMSPVSGKVAHTNERLRAQPHLVASHSLAEGWLFDLVPTAETSIAAQVSAQDEIRRGYDEDDARFRSLINASVNRGAVEVGPTLPDGGSRLDSLIAMVGPKKYCELLLQAFTAQGGPKRK